MKKQKESKDASLPRKGESKEEKEEIQEYPKLLETEKGGKIFKINKHLDLRLEQKGERKKTVIYVDGEEFMHCKYLLINVPLEGRELGEEEILSIDEAAAKLDNSLEGERREVEKGGRRYEISSEAEFWGHCSNLHAWVLSEYNTTVLGSRLSFPLLKKLSEAGDLKARKVFKEEVALRLQMGRRNEIEENVAEFLIREGYLSHFNKEEMEAVWWDVIESGNQKIAVALIEEGYFSDLSVQDKERIIDEAIYHKKGELINAILKHEDPTQLEISVEKFLENFLEEWKPDHAYRLCIKDRYLFMLRGERRRRLVKRNISRLPLEVLANLSISGFLRLEEHNEYEEIFKKQFEKRFDLLKEGELKREELSSLEEDFRFFCNHGFLSQESVEGKKKVLGSFEKMKKNLNKGSSVGMERTIKTLQRMLEIQKMKEEAKDYLGKNR